MILIITNRQDLTADFLILELRRRQVKYMRFNTEDFPSRVELVWTLSNGQLDGYFAFPNCRVDFSSIGSVWYRRPVRPLLPSTFDPIAHEFAEIESQSSLDGVLHCLDCLWVSHPDNLRKAELKLYQLRTASQLGFRVWPTVVTNNAEVARDFYHQQGGAIVYKPLRLGRLETQQELRLIYTSPIAPREVDEFHRVVYAPSLFQKYVPKSVEIRATVVGTKVFAVEIHSQDYTETLHDWRRGDTGKLRHEMHTLPCDLAARCVALVTSMGLSFGAIDLILTPEGEYVFLEINPNGQWAWIQQLCPDIHLREALADLLIGSQT